MLGLATCTKHTGGLDAITLYEPSTIESLGYDHSLGGFSEIVLSEGSLPETVLFAEGSAVWSEQLNGDGEIQHRVEFALHGTLTDQLQRLLSMARNGVVALVRRSDGESFLVGYSTQAKALYPLMVVEAETDSRAQSREGARSRVVLTSSDGWFARPYVGE